MGVHIDTYIEQSTHDVSIVRCFDRRTHAMSQTEDNSIGGALRLEQNATQSIEHSRHNAPVFLYLDRTL